MKRGRKTAWIGGLPSEGSCEAFGSATQNASILAPRSNGVPAAGTVGDGLSVVRYLVNRPR